MAEIIEESRTPLIVGRRWVTVAVAAMVALVLTNVPRTAHACSGSPFDVNDVAVVVAEGWVDRITFRPDLSSGVESDRSADPFMPVEISLRVTRWLRGGRESTLIFFDFTSVSRSTPRLPDGSLGLASANACGILTGDPTGMYALVVLARDSAGRLFGFLPYGAAFGDGPGDAEVHRLRQYLNGQLRPSALARAGKSAVSLVVPALGSALAGIGALLVGGPLVRRRRPVNTVA
jgi:hypothetical protein